jgi:integrase/recombinase XerD
MSAGDYDFSKYSAAAGIHPPISPHDLRHFFCSNALEKGFNVHEVAAIAEHSNIHTTLMYTNPSRKKFWRKSIHCNPHENVLAYGPKFKESLPYPI